MLHGSAVSSSPFNFFPVDMNRSYSVFTQSLEIVPEGTSGGWGVGSRLFHNHNSQEDLPHILFPFRISDVLLTQTGALSQAVPFLLASASPSLLGLPLDVQRVKHLSNLLSPNPHSLDDRQH